VRVYFTLGRSPVETNSVVVTICIVGVSDMYVGNFELQLRIWVVHAWLDVFTQARTN